MRRIRIALTAIALTSCAHETQTLEFSPMAPTTRISPPEIYAVTDVANPTPWIRIKRIVRRMLP